VGHAAQMEERMKSWSSVRPCLVRAAAQYFVDKFAVLLLSGLCTSDGRVTEHLENSKKEEAMVYSRYYPGNSLGI
jgi:hypothetical protein